MKPWNPNSFRIARVAASAMFVTGFFALRLSTAAAADLDGATGNIFKVDPGLKSFELLKETEYDPKTDLGQSRFTVFWTD